MRPLIPVKNNTRDKESIKTPFRLNPSHEPTGPYLRRGMIENALDGQHTILRLVTILRVRSPVPGQISGEGGDPAVRPLSLI